MPDVQLVINNQESFSPIISANAAAFNEIIHRPGNGWLKELHDNSPLPEKYHWRSLKLHAKTLFAATCAATVGVTYYIAGEKENKLEAAGIVTVNAIQLFHFSFETAEFFMTLQRSNLPGALVSAFIGVFATVSGAIAAYYVAQDSDIPWMAKHAVIAALLNAGGNFSQNMYGVFGNINKLKNYMCGNPEANRLVLDKMREAFLDNDYLSRAIPPERSILNKRMAIFLGTGFGAALMFNQSGYVCASDVFFTDLSNIIIGLALGLLTNAPNISMTFGITGRALIDKAADHLADRSGNKLSRREISYASLNAVFIAITSYLAMHSAASSTYLYENKCPEKIKNIFLKIMTNQGAQLFNGINTAIALNMLIMWHKVAYVQENIDEHAKYQVAAMAKTVRAMDKKDSASLAESLHLQKPEPELEPEPKRGCFARFFRSAAAAQDDYQAIVDNSEDRNRSWCTIM